MPITPCGGGAACGLGAAARPEPPERVERDEDEDDVDEDDVVVLAATAFSRRAASASRLARLRAARRCLESWRLSGTAATVGPPEDRRRLGGPTSRSGTAGSPGHLHEHVAGYSPHRVAEGRALAAPQRKSRLRTEALMGRASMRSARTLVTPSTRSSRPRISNAGAVRTTRR